MEPGQAMEAALQVVHPFTVPVALDPAAEQALLRLARPAGQILVERSKLLDYWHQQAVQLLPQSVMLIQQLEDPALRRLLLGNCSADSPELQVSDESTTVDCSDNTAKRPCKVRYARTLVLSESFGSSPKRLGGEDEDRHRPPTAPTNPAQLPPPSVG
eukprot:s105_g34.t1